MTLKVLANLAVAALLSLSFQASAQDTPKWWVIHCAQSKIVVPAGLNCSATQQISGGQSGWAADAEGTSREWLAAGAINGVQLVYTLVEATSMGAGFSPVALKDGIKLMMARGTQATNFSALANRGGADFMTFTVAGDSCVAVRRYGPSTSGGYKWILNALRCEPPGRTTSDAEIDRFIAGARVRGSS